MMKHLVGAIASVALVAGSATAVWADGGQKSSEGMNQQGGMDQPVVVGDEERMDEVAGLRIVPSVVAKDVALTPSAWILRDPASRHANANAKVYTNAQGEITNLTITSWGLPNPERIQSRFNDYVVWLVDTDTNEMKNIGVLESKNGGEAVFGFSPEVPLKGFDRIVITPEASGATRWPAGWQQLTAELPMMAVRPMEPGTTPMAPMDRTMPDEPMMP